MQGLTHVYFGEGKGKTTAALGLAIRAAGSGMNVLIVQFLKGQYTSELKVLKNISNIKILRGKQTLKFSFCMNKEEKQLVTKQHNMYLEEAILLANNGHCDMLILDELLGAISAGLIDNNMVKNFVENKPNCIELVITGRNAPKYIIDLADYASRIEKIKHPYDKGIVARIGIEK